MDCRIDMNYCNVECLQYLVCTLYIEIISVQDHNSNVDKADPLNVMVTSNSPPMELDYCSDVENDDKVCKIPMNVLTAYLMFATKC